MTDAEDMDVMVALADAIVDGYMGGHADANLATIIAGEHGRYRNASPEVRLLWALVGELINKVFDLENAV